MDNDTDVLEFDFPDYEEPYPPFPDVKIETFDKEDSYSRNRDIADRLYADKLKEKECRAKKRKRASHSKKHPLRRIFPIIALFLLVEAAALFISVGGGEWLIGLVFGGSLTYDLSYLDSITEQPETVLSEEEKAELLERKMFEDPFFESAKVSVRLESIGGSDPELTSQFYGFYEDDNAVTINFTVKNTGDEEIGFVPHRFYVKLKDGGVLSPRVADDGFFSYGDPNNPWYGMHIPAGEQVSFSVTYYISEYNASQIKCFAYNVYNNINANIHLYADIADEDGYVSRQIISEIEKLKNGGKEALP